MKGSEKQIKWAQDIINEAREAIKVIRRNLNRSDSKMGYNMLHFTTDDIDVVEADMEKTFKQIDQAAVIIDNRNAFTQHALEKMCALHNRSAK